MQAANPARLSSETGHREQGDMHTAVLGWLGGRASATIRLPNAISLRLLCPFQYFRFRVADPIDLDGLAWQRVGYRVDRPESALYLRTFDRPC
ncbi:MAG TPA: hypothetical protein DDZ51_13460 [Planctomycetaceae bacterium]|nr:hypothetical protein [Planctomycetaceae bacterium]